ncbi:MAG: hypothetical protein MK212_14115 [Saprospiraceae bacterium]|nr:hypothetical protein [Saprospiraceae bacterium]
MKSFSRNNLGENQGVYDPQLNLIYYYLYPQKIQGFFDKKVTTDFQHISNIAIWDIPKKRKFFLYEPKELGSLFIRNIYFEQAYDEQTMTIVMNNNSRNLNSHCLFAREPKNKLIIELYHPDKKETELWVSDKWGNGKEKLITVEPGMKWHLDIHNDILRVVEHTGNDVEIQDFAW